MKNLQVVSGAIFSLLVFTAISAKADTVVHYTFDDLGDVGAGIADRTTVVNKANPGTLDATVYGMQGNVKNPLSTAMPNVVNGVPESLRVLDPVNSMISSSADKALHFRAGHSAGNSAILEIPNDAALRPSSFTVEMFLRLTQGREGWQMLACQPSSADGLYGWSILVKQYGNASFLLRFTKPDGTHQECQFGAGTFLYDWKWHHIAMTVAPHATDSSKSVVKFYVDYVEMYSYDAPFVLTLSDSSNCPVQIGGTTVSNYNFTGEIGEFRFSSGVLDAGEFLRPHNKDIDEDVVLYYDFEDGDVYDGNFAYSESVGTDIVNKASPILSGGFVTKAVGEKGALPKVDGEAAPVSRLRSSMSDPLWADNSSSLYNGYEGDRNNYFLYLYCDTPSSMSLANTDFTVEMFCKADGSVKWWTGLFKDNNDQLFMGVGSTDNRIYCRVTQDDGTTQKAVADTTNINDDKWHHIALVRSGTTLTLYRDRRAVASETLTSDSLKAIGNRWQICGSPNGGAYAFNGWMDSLRVTRRALKAEEFLTSQNYPTGRTIAHLKFDDGTANAADDGGALFDGVMNGATFSNNVPGYKITDGEGGPVLSKPNVASLSVPNTSAFITWGGWEDQYYLRKDINGNERSSGTVELWVKGNTKKTFAAILDAKMTEDGAYSDNLHIWRLGYDESYGGKPSVFFHYLKTDGTRDKQRLTFDKEVTDGKWHHWAFTFKPNAADPTKSDIAFYLDHVQLGSIQTLPGRVAYDDTLRFAIGEGGSSFTGLIDEVRISDCVLAPSEFLRAEKPGFMMILR